MDIPNRVKLEGAGPPGPVVRNDDELPTVHATRVECLFGAAAKSVADRDKILSGEFATVGVIWQVRFSAIGWKLA